MTEDGGDQKPPHDEPGAAEVLESSSDLEPVKRRTLAETERLEAITTQTKTDADIQKLVGYGSLIAMAVQLVVADGVFIVYCSVKGWGHVPTGAIQAWLGATVVQIVGVVIVVTRSVFPERGRGKR